MCQATDLTSGDAASPAALQSNEGAEALRVIEKRVEAWGDNCFGHAINHDPVERHFRCLEEALELAQTMLSKSDALALVEYVFDRPKGDPAQEIGGLTTSLAALCYALKLDWQNCALEELEKMERNVEHIRRKRGRKPKHLLTSSAPASAQPSIEERSDTAAPQTEQPLDTKGDPQ